MKLWQNLIYFTQICSTQPFINRQTQDSQVSPSLPTAPPWADPPTPLPVSVRRMNRTDNNEARKIRTQLAQVSSELLIPLLERKQVVLLARVWDAQSSRSRWGCCETRRWARSADFLDPLIVGYPSIMPPLLPASPPPPSLCCVFSGSEAKGSL